MSLYPTLPDQTFWLGRIQETDTFLGQEAESRRRIQKKYLRAVNIAHGLSTGTWIVGVGLGGAGIPLVASGIGILPGILCSALGIEAFCINVVCDVVIRRCTKKAMKHAEIARCALDKSMSIHKQVSEGLRHASISAEEFDRILEKEVQYQRTKEEIHSKVVVTDDGKRKKKWLEIGRQEVLKELATRLGSK